MLTVDLCFTLTMPPKRSPETWNLPLRKSMRIAGRASIIPVETAKDFINLQ
jgi:hypothetical protein